VDIPEVSITQENVQMTQKPSRKFTAEQKADAVRIVVQSGKTVHQVAKEMGLTESALRRWVKQAQIDQQSDPQGRLTSSERKELNELRRDLKRVQLERDFLKKAATFFGMFCGGIFPRKHFHARDSSTPMS
jgi:transposase